MTKTNNNMNLKKVFGTIQTLLIVVLIIIILLMRNCSGNSNPKPKPKEIVKTTIEYIPVNKEIPVYIPKWKEKIVIDIDTFLVNVDTNAILSDYYAKYYFVDTMTQVEYKRHCDYTKPFLLFRHCEQNRISLN